MTRDDNAKRKALQEKWSPSLGNGKINKKPKQTPTSQPCSLHTYADSYGVVWNEYLEYFFQLANESLMKGAFETFLFCFFLFFFFPLSLSVCK